MGADDIDRFSLVTAAHHFLSTVLPFREPQSQRALADFIVTLGQAGPPSAVVDAILLRSLVILDTQHERRIPSLVDRYLAAAPTRENSMARFDRCVQDFLRFRCVSDHTVQQAIDIIGESCAVDHRALADSIGLRLSTLDLAFRRQMGCTISGYVREIRLERSALLLVTTNKSIKEICVEIGYKHPSNFGRDFKRRFAMSPREFRATAILPLAQRHYGHMTTRCKDSGARELNVSSPAMSRKHVLIVDDDDCTRSTLSTYLTRERYVVSVARTGREGLRLAKEGLPDVILLDFRLSDMDGLTYLRTLRRESPGDVSAVVVFTADWTLYDRRTDLQSLQAMLASKLCDIKELGELIKYLSSRGT